MELVKPVEPVLWACIVELVMGGTGYGTVEALGRRADRKGKKVGLQQRREEGRGRQHHQASRSGRAKDGESFHCILWRGKAFHPK